MSILNFIQALLPRVERSTVEEDVRLTLRELETLAIPQYAAAGQQFRVIKPKSTLFKETETYFYRKVELGRKGPNLLVDIEQALSRVLTNLKFIQSQVETALEADVLSEGITVRRAHILRAAASISFISSFSLEFLNHLVKHEEEAAGIETDIAPAAQRFFEKNQERFYAGLNDYGLDADKFEKLFASLPDVVVTRKNAASVTAAFKQSILDPFSHQGLQGFTGNPLYHIRLLVVEWQNDRHDANVDKKKALELKLLRLKAQENGGGPNANLDKQIDYLENRIGKLERKILAYEDNIERARGGA